MAAGALRKWHPHFLLAVSILIPTVFVLVAGVQTYRHALQAADRNLRNGLTILEEQAGKVFDTHELVRRLVDEHIGKRPWSEIGASSEVNAFLGEIAERFEQVGSIWLIDWEGWARSTSLAFPAPKLNFTDRDYYQYLRRHEGPFVSTTYPGKLTGRDHFNVVTHRMSGAGETRGFVCIAVDANYFKTFLTRLVGRHSGGFAGIIRADGEPIVVFSPGGGAAAIDALAGAVAALEEGPSASVLSREENGRRFGVAKLANFPVYLVFGMSSGDVLADWFAVMRTYLGFAFLSAIILSGLSLVVTSRLRRQKQLTTELEAMVEERSRELERANTQKHFTLASKMEALGNMAGGMAHELNNVLVPILGLSDLALREVEKGGRLHQRLDALHRAAGRARDIVRQVLLFSRAEPLKAHLVLAATAVDDAIRLVRLTTPSTVTLQCRITAEDALVMADETQLNQVLINLINNSVDAIGNGIGFIEVSLTERLIEGEESAGWLALAVHDDGCGMDRATQAKLFEPFFTTKPVGQGTGMGLPVVHGIVTAWGGSVKVASAPGQGTTVTILLPIAPAGQERPPENATHPLLGASS